MAPPKGRSKAKASQMKKIGEFSKNTKTINQMDLKWQEQIEIISVKNKEINKAKCRLDRKKIKLAKIEKQIDETNIKLLRKNGSSVSSSVFSITSKKAKLRKNTPTTKATPHTARTIRRNETMTVCSLIHGNKEATYGILDTLTSKVKSKELVESVFDAKPSFVNELESKVMVQSEKN